MGKRIKYCLLAFLIAGLSVSAAQAAKTKFTNVEVTGTLDVDGAMTTGSCACTNISTSAFSAASVSATYGVTAATFTATGASTFVGVTASTVTLSGQQALRLSASYITATTTVPAAANIIGIDSSHIVYISTGTGAGAWVKLSTQ